MLPGAWQTFASLFGILILGSLLSPIQPLDPYLPWIMLGLLVWVLMRKRVVHRGKVDIPTAPGEEVLLRQSSLKFYTAETMWRRIGGGTSFHVGRRFGKKWYGGISTWSSGSTSTRREYLQKYYGGAMLTNRRLFVVDGVSMATRLVIPIQTIASISMTRRNRITVSWGASTPRTIVLEFTGLVRQEVVESARQWETALHELTSGASPRLVHTSMPAQQP